MKVDRKKFREFLNDNFGMTDQIIMDRLFKYFNKQPTDDIDLEEWITGFSIILKGLYYVCLTSLNMVDQQEMKRREHSFVLIFMI